MKTGGLVRAKVQIAEEGDELWVFAEPGDIGRVVDVFEDGWVMVAWEIGACQCHTDELESAGSAESAEDDGSGNAESESAAPVSGVDLDSDHGPVASVDLDRHEGV